MATSPTSCQVRQERQQNTLIVQHKETCQGVVRVHESPWERAAKHREIREFFQHALQAFFCSDGDSVGPTQNNQQSLYSFLALHLQHLCYPKLSTVSVKDQGSKHTSAIMCLALELVGNVPQCLCPRTRCILHPDAAFTWCHLSPMHLQHGTQDNPFREHLLPVCHRPTVERGEVELHCCPCAQHEEAPNVLLEATPLSRAHAQRDLCVLEATAPGVHNAVTMAANSWCSGLLLEVPTVLSRSTPVEDTEGCSAGLVAASVANAGSQNRGCTPRTTQRAGCHAANVALPARPAR
mmetsp:Transcript_47267/g.109375  ORF Transcript_47267/g.109375 Transcript_47267/m.109375 type:complete len:294 (+) Transcript_47267:477-1358(+)